MVLAVLLVETDSAGRMMSASHTATDVRIAGMMDRRVGEEIVDEVVVVVKVADVIGIVIKGEAEAVAVKTTRTGSSNESKILDGPEEGEVDICFWLMHFICSVKIYVLIVNFIPCIASRHFCLIESESRRENVSFPEFTI